MSHIQVIHTKGKNNSWWDVIEKDYETQIPGVECFKRLGVFSSMVDLNLFLLDKGLIKEQAVLSDHRRETR